MTSWPIFHDPLTSSAWRLFDGRLLYRRFSRREAGASVYFGHISSFYHLFQLRAHLVRISWSNESEKFIGRGYRTGVCCISGVHHISTYLFWKWRKWDASEAFRKQILHQNKVYKIISKIQKYALYPKKSSSFIIISRARRGCASWIVLRRLWVPSGPATYLL